MTQAPSKSRRIRNLALAPLLAVLAWGLLWLVGNPPLEPAVWLMAAFTSLFFLAACLIQTRIEAMVIWAIVTFFIALGSSPILWNLKRDLIERHKAAQEQKLR